MICSTIIPTIGRGSLSRAVESVLQQDFDRDEFEVIVVNDSGKPLPHQAWMDSKHVSLLHTNRLNRSVARNTGAAVARGKYLHFWMTMIGLCRVLFKKFGTLQTQRRQVGFVVPLLWWIIRVHCSKRSIHLNVGTALFR